MYLTKIRDEFQPPIFQNVPSSLEGTAYSIVCNVYWTGFVYQNAKMPSEVSNTETTQGVLILICSLCCIFLFSLLVRVFVMHSPLQGKFIWRPQAEESDGSRTLCLCMRKDANMPRSTRQPNSQAWLMGFSELTSGCRIEERERRKDFKPFLQQNVQLG